MLIVHHGGISRKKKSLTYVTLMKVYVLMSLPEQEFIFINISTGYNRLHFIATQVLLFSFNLMTSQLSLKRETVLVQ
jgi:hypothetical protein